MRLLLLLLPLVMFPLAYGQPEPEGNDKPCGDIGKTYEDLTRGWWNWVSIIPNSTMVHPLLDYNGTTTELANQKYNPDVDRVYYLTGSYNSGFSRTIHITYGTAVFFPVLDGGYWAAPTLWQSIFVDVYKNLKDKSAIDSANDYYALMDSKPDNRLINGTELPMVRVTTMYDQYYPKDTFYAFDNAPTDGTFVTVVDGYWTCLTKEDLPRGEHELMFSAKQGDAYRTMTFVKLVVS